MKQRIDKIILSIEEAIDSATSNDAVECLRASIDHVKDALGYEVPDTEGDTTYEKQHRQTGKDLF